MSRLRKALAFAALPAALVVGAGYAQTGPKPAGAGAAIPTKAASGPALPSPSGKRYGIGRPATKEEVAGWDIDIRPDGQGLPIGKGTAKQGEALYMERCAACHGEFGESAGRWPVIAGGAGTLKSHDPVKTVGSYWPYASTLMDYIRRAMPYGNAQSLTNDELYAVTAYVLSLNEVIKDESFELNEKSFASLKMPNQPNFYDDDRETSEKHFWKREPCMKACAPEAAKITGRARVLDVTPEAGKGPKVE